MTHTGAGARLQRLDELKGLLREGAYSTAVDLAQQLGVSVRTLTRDLAVLREAGVPIEAERGRGGGVRVQRNWTVGRLHLTPEESLDLLLSLAIAERLSSPLLLRSVSAIRRKMFAAFPTADQLKLKSLRKRVLVGRPASARVIASFSPPPRKALSELTQAFVETQCLALEYVTEDGHVTLRHVEPQFLYLNVPVWYLLVWDRSRDGIRSFRVDRIRGVRRLEERFRVADPQPYLAQAERDIQTL